MTSPLVPWDEAVPDLRVRLVQRARRLGLDAESAEDVAQEALSEAWRLRDRIYDPAGFDRWLYTILGNVCRRWVQSRQRERDLSVPDNTDSALSAADRADDGFDIEVELERRELAELLDRALALLPEGTREALVRRFVEETPVAEVADRLGLSEGAVQMRLQRGKLALRQILTATYRDDAVAFGLIDEAEAGWQETRIWCPGCGSNKWHGRFTGPTRRLELRCTRCGAWDIVDSQTLRFGVKGFRTALKKVAASAYDVWRDGGQGVRTHPHKMRLERDVGSFGDWAHAYCAKCEGGWRQTLEGHALFTPEGMRFWRDHSRIRRVEYRELEAGGVPAVLTAYQSVTDGARLDLVLTRDGWHLVRTHRS